MGELSILGQYQQAGEQALKRLTTPLEENENYNQRKRRLLLDLGQQLGAQGKSRSLVALNKYTAPALISLQESEMASRRQQEIPIIGAGLEAAKTEESARAREESARQFNQTYGLQLREQDIGESQFLQKLAYDQKALEQQKDLFVMNLDQTTQTLKTEQDFMAAEAALNRQQEMGIITKEQQFAASQRIQDRAFEEGILEKGQRFQATEAEKTRALEIKRMAQDTKMFLTNLETTTQNLKTAQDFEIAEAAMRQQYDLEVLNLQQKFDAEQQMLNKAFEVGLISEEQKFRAEESAKNRALEVDRLAQDKDLFLTNLETTAQNLKTAQDFEAAKEVLNRQHDLDVINAQEAAQIGMALIERETQLGLMDAQQAYDETERLLDRNHQKTLAAAELKFRNIAQNKDLAFKAIAKEEERRFEAGMAIGNFLGGIVENSMNDTSIFEDFFGGGG